MNSMAILIVIWIVYWSWFIYKEPIRMNPFFGMWIGCGLSVPVIVVIEFLFDRASEAQMFLSLLAAGFVYTFLVKKFVYPTYEKDGPSNFD